MHQHSTTRDANMRDVKGLVTKILHAFTQAAGSSRDGHPSPLQLCGNQISRLPGRLRVYQCGTSIMAFAIETIRDVSPKARQVGQKSSSRVLTVGTILIGTSVVAFAWVVATAFTLQSVIGPYAPGSSTAQTPSPLLAKLAASSSTGHSSLRLGAVDLAGNRALALAKAQRSTVAAEMAALATSYSVIAKSDRTMPVATEVADAGKSLPALGKSSRPLPADVLSALRLALAATPSKISDAAATETASIDLNRNTTSPVVASVGLGNGNSTAPVPMPNPAVAATTSSADRPVQMAMIETTTASTRNASALATQPAKPVRVSTQANRDTVPRPRPDDTGNGLPSSAAAMVEPEDRRANVAVEQTFGLVMPTASGDAAGNASADDMLMSSIPLPTMRPAPSPDAATTPAAKLTRPSKALLAYARPDDAGMDNEPVFRAPASLPNARTRVAIYDISAARVYLPNGEQLEAHSGLGQMIDNPRYVNQKNRGPTPPHTYDLTMRESLFHGVEAIRLNPVNPAAIYGRDGLLAHTYMLGRRGDSNGCVSFKDYRRFLAAFKRGEVNRLLVVPHLSVAPGRIASR